VQIIGSWGFVIVYGILASALMLLTLGLASRWLAPILLRFWGRTMLRLAGITYEVQGAEYVQSDTMKIVPFNHGSLVDAFLVPVVMPPGSVAAIKREVIYYPVFGLAVYLLGLLLIDRGSSARARRIMDRAAARMAKERLTVFIAPEGTRGLTGELLPFKKGVMHLALASHAPIVPMLISSSYDLHPPGKLSSTPGHIVIRFLPPRSTVGLTTDSVHAETESLHSLFVTELARLRNERLGAQKVRA